MTKTELKNLEKGLMKIRRYTRFGTDYKKMAQKMEECGDKNVAFALQKWDGDPKALAKKAKSIEGATSNVDLEAFGFNLAKKDSVPKANAKVAKKADGKALSKKKPKIRLIEPEIIGCPETDELGNEVFLTATKDKRFSCATLQYED